MPVTQADVKALLDYDPETGQLINKVLRNKNGAPKGAIAGSIKHCRPKSSGKQKKYYVIVSIQRKQYRAHRIIWLWMTGEWPKEEIDHIDGDGTNNKWLNLRQVTTAENGKNKCLLNTNTSGYMGVNWDKSRGKWCAYIKSNRRKIHLGRFVTLEDAVAKRKSAEVALGFHPNHGREAILQCP